jgi:glucan 1,3-beta-glucosidase
MAIGFAFVIGNVAGHMSTTFSNLDYVPVHKRRLDVNETAPVSINAQWQCPPVAPEHVDTHNKYKLRAVNLGSWMVLEPWITPTLFFQFLGKEVLASGGGDDRTSQDSIGMDMYSFCKALGPVEGNRQLRAHWDSWVSETDIAQLATSGINTIRVPVGDWMYNPYEPYIGCTDGALDQMERLFYLCRRYNLKVLVDIHAVRGSQNGFDNSGQTMNVEWTTFSSTKVAGTATFVHWPYRSASWMGSFDPKTATYFEKNEDNIQHTLDTIQNIVDMYANESVVMGLEPVNEPWQFTPLEWLKQFYWDGYEKIRKSAPHWLFLMHDAFMFDVYVWGDFMLNCPNIGLDTHIYQAWLDPMPQASYLANACDVKKVLTLMEAAGMPVVVGEWSLATDNCAMWLNGFNDNLPGFPRVQCTYTQCPLPYMGPGIIPGAPVNPNSPPQGPFGTGSSTPSYGQCPIDKKWHNDKLFMRDIASSKLFAYESVHGWAFWNFKTELEPRWSYIQGTLNGYFPNSVAELEKNKYVNHVCDTFEGIADNKFMPDGVFSTVYDENGNIDLVSVTLIACALLSVAALMVFVAKRRRQDGFAAIPLSWSQ